MNRTMILIVEDDQTTAEALSAYLEHLGYGVAAVVDTGEVAVEMAMETRPDLVLMDIVLKGAMDGVEAAQLIRSRTDTPILYLTGYANEALLQRAKATEPAGYIVKPTREGELRAMIEIALHRDRIEKRLRQTARVMASAMRNLGDAVITTDSNSRVVFMNPAAESLTGVHHVDAMGRPVDEVFRVACGRTAGDGGSLAARAIDGRAPAGGFEQVLLESAAGVSVLVEVSASPVRDVVGRVAGAVLVFRDRAEQECAQEALRQAYEELEKQVQERTRELERTSRELLAERAERRWAEEALRQSEERFRLTLKRSPLVVFNQDKDLRYTWVYNPHRDLDSEAILGKTDAELLPPEEASLLTEIKQQALESGVGARGEAHIVEDGRTFYYDVIVEPLRNDSSEVVGITGASVNVTERKQLEERLRGLSLVDDLTGLYNRRGFLTLAEQQLKIAGRAMRKMLQIFADVDGLKRINDTHGHEEGDRALVETARILRRTFRSSDIVARIGGDEFAILASESQEGSEAICAARLRRAIETWNAQNSRVPFRLSLSVGVIDYDPHAPCSIEELLARADSLMYEEKKRKRANA